MIKVFQKCIRFVYPAEQSRLGEERLTAMAEASVSYIVMDDAEVTLCETDPALIPSVNEYHVLVKTGTKHNKTHVFDKYNLAL